MKKISILIIALFIANISSAQFWGGKKVKGNGKVITENRNTPDYDGVAVAGFFDVLLVSGDEGTITVKGEENLLEHLITEVENNVLKIKVEKGYNLRPSWNKTITVTVPFTSLSNVSLAGSGDVIGKAPIKASNFKTSLAGSGDIELAIDAENVKVGVAGSGDIKLNGNTNTLNAKISGSGDIYALDLKAENVEAAVSGSGDISVNVSNELVARVSGSGDITYKGNPKRKDAKVSGSGDVSEY